jgi:hypothetical protein
LEALGKRFKLAPGWRATAHEHSLLLTQALRGLELRLEGDSALAARGIIEALGDTLVDAPGEVRGPLNALEPAPAQAPRAKTETEQQVLQLLQDAGALWPRAQAVAAAAEEPFSRNVAFWELFAEQASDAEDIHARLTAAHVVLVGVGGFGSWLAYLLAGSGVGRLSLLDDDVVSASNLSRQLLYAVADVGRAKVHAAQVRLGVCFPSLQIDVFERRVAQAPDLDDVLSRDALVLAPMGLPGPAQALSPVHQALLQACARHGAGLMFCGSGFVGPILRRPSRESLEAFLHREAVAAALATAAWPANPGGTAAQPALVSRLGITASLCAWEATRYLAGLRCYALERLIAVDTLHYSGVRLLE